MNAQRLFFALWPSDSLRAQLAAATGPIVTRGEGRTIPPQNFHITLAFLGGVHREKVAGVMAAASELGGSPLRLSIERVEVWRGADILCVTPTATPSLHDFVDRMRIKLLERQVEPDRQDFRPHVTLARDWVDRSVEGAIGPFEWRADEFVLVASEATRDGSRYRVVDRWPLTG